MKQILSPQKLPENMRTKSQQTFTGRSLCAQHCSGLRDDPCPPAQRALHHWDLELKNTYLISGTEGPQMCETQQKLDSEDNVYTYMLSLFFLKKTWHAS